MTIRFGPNLVYPSDRQGGRYQEFQGTAIEVDEWEPHEPGSRIAKRAVRVVVKIPGEEQTYAGYTEAPPPVGATVTIRVYDCGGGWYPDSRIQGWSSPRPRKTFWERLNGAQSF